jgi:hypothetical protein
MAKTDPDEHHEASDAPPVGESTGETSSGGSRLLTDKERSGLIEDARRFKESHKKSFRLLSREGVPREDTSRENMNSEDQ